MLLFPCSSLTRQGEASRESHDLPAARHPCASRKQRLHGMRCLGRRRWRLPSCGLVPSVVTTTHPPSRRWGSLSPAPRSSRSPAGPPSPLRTCGGTSAAEKRTRCAQYLCQQLAAAGSAASRVSQPDPPPLPDPDPSRPSPCTAPPRQVRRLHLQTLRRGERRRRGPHVLLPDARVRVRLRAGPAGRRRRARVPVPRVREGVLPQVQGAPGGFRRAPHGCVRREPARFPCVVSGGVPP